MSTSGSAAHSTDEDESTSSNESVQGLVAELKLLRTDILHHMTKLHNTTNPMNANRIEHRYKGIQYEESPPPILINGDTIRNMKPFTGQAHENVIEHLDQFELNAAAYIEEFWLDLVMLTLGTSIRRTAEHHARLTSYGAWRHYRELKSWLLNHYACPHYHIDQLTKILYLGTQTGSVDRYFLWLDTRISYIGLPMSDATRKTIALNNMNAALAETMRKMPETYTMSWESFCIRARLESRVLEEKYCGERGPNIYGR